MQSPAGKEEEKCATNHLSTCAGWWGGVCACVPYSLDLHDIQYFIFITIPMIYQFI